ncbi:MAG: alpha/beta hydrolase [Gemmatimonadetes bacterium]|nr:alpha/beta hydrolase [Gemmatimonadota bacterium]
MYAHASGRPLHVDLYLPRDRTAPSPLVVWLHSGGWRVGNRKRAPDLSRHFAAHGFAMASIDYRLSREAVFPAQLHDVRAALRWLRINAERFGIDARRVGLWGASAGGHLAALAAFGARVDDEVHAHDDGHADVPVDVQALAIGYAPMDFLTMDAQRERGAVAIDDPAAFTLPAGARITDARSYESLLIGASVSDRPDLARAASPIAHVRSHVPPTLIVHGTGDSAIPAAQSEQLYEALARCGNDVTLYLVHGFGHGFMERDDFDAGPPRAVEVHHARGGEAERVTDGPPLSFDTIEHFFRLHLGDPA